MENNKKIMLPQSKQDDTKVKQDATSTDAATVTATAADAATLHNKTLPKSKQDAIAATTVTVTANADDAATLHNKTPLPLTLLLRSCVIKPRCNHLC